MIIVEFRCGPGQVISDSPVGLALNDALSNVECDVRLGKPLTIPVVLAVIVDTEAVRTPVTTAPGHIG